MRIKLKEGKQKILINKFREDKKLTWIKLSNFLGIKFGKLKAYVDETSLLPEDIYNKLNTDELFSKYILEKKKENWGKVKGGLNSCGNLKSIKIPEKSKEFAEFYGIMLGDGNSHKTKSYKKGTYMIRIVGDSRYDKDYLFNYVKSLVENLFSIKTHSGKFKKQNAIYIEAHSFNLIEFLNLNGFKPGNKIKNKLTIPFWIKENNSYLKCCLRGLIDTDGSIFRMSKRDSNLIRISFTNYNLRLLNDTRESFLELGFHPSKIIHNRQFFISRQEEIKKYLKEIGFSNKKHLKRVKSFFSPMV